MNKIKSVILFVIVEVVVIAFTRLSIYIIPSNWIDDPRVYTGLLNGFIFLLQLSAFIVFFRIVRKVMQQLFIVKLWVIIEFAHIFVILLFGVLFTFIDFHFEILHVIIQLMSSIGYTFLFAFMMYYFYTDRRFLYPLSVLLGLQLFGLISMVMIYFDFTIDARYWPTVITILSKAGLIYLLLDWFEKAEDHHMIGEDMNDEKNQDTLRGTL